jgi:uncharacterized protein with NAD-binding domain and iron-sulfur cluster
MKRKTKRKKIAILGGGIGALTAAYELAKQGRYEITVYQKGWRLGGQGASGRNHEEHDRIEEHGLHIWFGFYENAFHLMQQCYDDMSRRPSEPLATARSAFTGLDEFVFLEKIGRRTPPWKITFSSTNEFPGTPVDPSEPDVLKEMPSLAYSSQRILKFARRQLRKIIDDYLEPTLDIVSSDIRAGLPRLAQAILIARTAQIGTELTALEIATEVLAIFHTSRGLRRRQAQDAIAWLLTKTRNHIEKQLADLLKTDDEIRRDWIIFDLVMACVTGIVSDNLASAGLNSINDQDFREWLKKHGASEATANSILVQALYDASFAYEDGKVGQPNLAAGVGLRVALRLTLGFRGHVLYKMNAGMGDTVFAPLYLALKKRGVKFKFFHRVKELCLSRDKTSIQSIHLARQVTLNDEEYDPFIYVNGLPCWPNKPRFEQIKEGQKLIDRDVDLEADSPKWRNADPKVCLKWRDADGKVCLEAEDDFDVVILGISIGALPGISRQLKRVSRNWRHMMKNIKTVRTQATQIWFKRTSQELEWPTPDSIISGFDLPVASWIDFTQLIPREAWPREEAPQSVFYGCGPLKDSRRPFGRQVVGKAIQNVLRKRGRLLWPAGIRGIKSRYDRANENSSDRYVLSLPSEGNARLKPGESGFRNLYLAGVWTNNGLNISSIEAGVISGKQASRAISENPRHIVGERDLTLP